MMDAHNPLISDREAREYQDARAVADRLLDVASKHGKPSKTLHGQIFGQREKVQAMCLGLEALRILEARQYSLVDDTLALLEKYIRADCDDHQTLAEIGEAMAELWTKMAEDEWEREKPERDPLTGRILNV